MGIIDIFNFKKYFKNSGDGINAKVGHVNMLAENMTLIIDKSKDVTNDHIGKMLMYKESKARIIEMVPSSEATLASWQLVANEAIVLPQRDMYLFDFKDNPVNGNYIKYNWINTDTQITITFVDTIMTPDSEVLIGNDITATKNNFITFFNTYYPETDCHLSGDTTVSWYDMYYGQRNYTLNSEMALQGDNNFTPFTYGERGVWEIYSTCGSYTINGRNYNIEFINLFDSNNIQNTGHGTLINYYNTKDNKTWTLIIPTTIIDFLYIVKNYFDKQLVDIKHEDLLELVIDSENLVLYFNSISENNNNYNLNLSGIYFYINQFYATYAQQITYDSPARASYCEYPLLGILIDIKDNKAIISTSSYLKLKVAETSNEIYINNNTESTARLLNIDENSEVSSVYTGQDIEIMSKDIEIMSKDMLIAYEDIIPGKTILCFKMFNLFTH